MILDKLVNGIVKAIRSIKHKLPFQTGSNDFSLLLLNICLCKYFSEYLHIWSPNIIHLSFCVSEFLHIEETILYFRKPHTHMGENEKFSISMHWSDWIKSRQLKKESINPFPVILILNELLNGKHSFRKDGLQVSLYGRTFWGVKWGNIFLRSCAR